VTEQRFVIPGRLAGANELIGAANQHRFAGASIKKRETKFCAQCCRDLRPISKQVRIGIRWIERDYRRDIDNVAFGVKFILDGLREAGKLPNDGRRWVSVITHEFPESDKENPRVEVIVTEELDVECDVSRKSKREERSR
jgi:Holliday junction resolvase RusA-like endonuclease